MNALSTSMRHDELCPLDSTLKVLDGKWKTIILCRLMHQELRYTEILNSLSGCTRRMLSLQLSQLIEDHIIVKNIDTNYIPIKTSYRLTKLGHSLVPIIESMDTWGKMYIDTIQSNDDLLDIKY